MCKIWSSLHIKWREGKIIRRGKKASRSDGLPAARTHRSVPLVQPRGGTEALYLGLSVLEASEARFISEEAGLASTALQWGKMERGKGGWGPQMAKVVPTNRSTHVRNLQVFGFSEYECPVGRAH